MISNLLYFTRTAIILETSKLATFLCRNINVATTRCFINSNNNLYFYPLFIWVALILFDIHIIFRMLRKHSNPLILFLFILKIIVCDGRQLQYMSNRMFIYYTYIILHLFIQVFFPMEFILFCVYLKQKPKYVLCPNVRFHLSN